MNVKPAVIELDVGPASKCPLWVDAVEKRARLTARTLIPGVPGVGGRFGDDGPTGSRSGAIVVPCPLKKDRANGFDQGERAAFSHARASGDRPDPPQSRAEFAAGQKETLCGSLPGGDDSTIPQVVLSDL